MLTHLDWPSLTASRLVISAVRCRLPTAPLRRPSPTAFSEFLSPTPDSRSLTHFRSRRRSQAQAFVWFRAKTKGLSAWRTPFIVSHPHQCDAYHAAPRRPDFQDSFQLKNCIHPHHQVYHSTILSVTIAFMFSFILLTTNFTKLIPLQSTSLPSTTVILHLPFQSSAISEVTKVVVLPVSTPALNFLPFITTSIIGSVWSGLFIG